MRTYYLLTLFAMSILHAASSPWTVLLFMNPGHELSDMALKNINDLLSANANVNILLQVHAYGEHAVRYVVKPGLLQQESTVQLMGGKQDIVNFFAWGMDKAPAEHYMLILWGSGFGILDPVWDDEQERWSPEPDDNEMPIVSCELIVGVEKRYRTLKQKCRGILLSEEPREYLANDEFAESLHDIHAMLGKKIDIIGLDMCLGSMIEHMYQAAPYADFLIGSQNCELKDGWDYKAFGDIFAHHTSPHDVACTIADAFQNYYEPRAPQGNYTQAVVELCYATQLKEALDAVVQKIKECATIYGQPLHDAVHAARKQSTRFCFMPMYTDIVTWCRKLQEELKSLSDSPPLQGLSDALEKVCDVVKKAVKANATGYAMKDKARGISIYFPFMHIDSSYDNHFSRDSRWLEFLHYACNCQAGEIKEREG